MHRLSLALVSMTLSPLALTSQERAACSAPPVVDMKAHTVAGVPLEPAIDSVRKLLDPAAIRQISAGRYLIRICAIALDRTGHGVRWTDARLRTREGLGVGSTIQAFDASYGKGEVVYEEGTSVRYWAGRGYFFLELPASCFGEKAGAVNRSCKVSAIYLVVA